MGTDRKRLVMWRRLMLMYAAAPAQASNDSVTDVDTSGSEREIPESVARSEASRA
jgi:hypothetical protein